MNSKRNMLAYDRSSTGLWVALIFLVSLNLRPAIAAVGPVLAQMGTDLAWGEGVQGVLTAIPLIAFAVVSAWHLCSWYRDARYCGRCGEKLVHDVNERMMRCPKCGNMIFPRINPSVIVAVTHGDYLLLTKYANRPGAQRTALVAGFTEFAESFEQTVHREVMEEVGLKVKDLRYYRCQPWGISGNIMMGYWCRLDGDDDTIHLDNFELADGAWVSREELRENYTGNGIALTSEMIAEFAAGRDPYSLEKNK